jgi:hypothetical protein
MIWTLIFLTNMGVQPAGQFVTQADCQRASREWVAMGVKSGCVQTQQAATQMEPREAMVLMQSWIRIMRKEME